GGEQRRGAVARRRHHVPAGGEVDPQGLQEGGFVVDHEHGCHPVTSRVTATGSEMTMVSPPPGVSSARIVPSIASTNPFATDRPSPTPVVVLRSPSRWNGANAESAAPFGKPRPWSTTRSSTRPP